MADLAYAIVLAPLSEEEGGGFAAYVPDLYGCMSDGDTVEEAVANVQVAIDEWCDEMRRLGREIPEPGSAEREAVAERESWADVIAKQDETLKEQTEVLTRLTAELDSLKQVVAEHFTPARKASVGRWEIATSVTRAPSMLAAIAHAQAHDGERSH